MTDSTDNNSNDLETESEKALATAAESSGSESAGEDGPTAASFSFGSERWVMLVFIIIAVLTAFVVDHVGLSIWDALASRYPMFGNPNPSYVTAAAAVLGLVFAVMLYRRDSSYNTVSGVVEELTKVTWPKREEVTAATLVVAATSVIAAVYTGALDNIFQRLTDLIYGGGSGS